VKATRFSGVADWFRSLSPPVTLFKAFASGMRVKVARFSGVAGWFRSLKTSALPAVV